MVGLNTFSIIMFIGITSLVIKTSRLETNKQNRIIKILALLLLAINTPKLLMNPMEIPVEFSTVTYFITPLILLLNIKKIEIWAVYSALMAGFFYYLTMISAGGNIYNLYSPINIYTSLFSHGTLLFIGLLKLKTIKYKNTDYYKIIIGNLLILSWAIYIRPEITNSGRIFIYELIDANIVYSITSSYLWLFIPIYYIVMFYLVKKSYHLIFRLNNYLTSKNRILSNPNISNVDSTKLKYNNFHN